MFKKRFWNYLIEGVPLSSAAPLLRGDDLKKKKKRSQMAKPQDDKETKKKTESMRIRESVMVGDAIPANTDPKAALEGPRVKVILLTEGLGNMHDLNYYGPEAVQSMPGIFEGTACMLNHLSYEQEKNRPEGDVESTVGYYKNLHVETIEGKLACCGELHFDLSESGKQAYEKALTAIHYRSEFPTGDKEYIGLSVNANGESEERRMTIEGETLVVNYVLHFKEARSCDIVTLPARGGRFVALVESMNGAQMKNNKEVRTMIVKRLKAASAALKEAQSEKDPDLRLKKISEAQKWINSLTKEAVEAVRRAKEDEAGEDEDKDEDEDESNRGKEAEDEAEAAARCADNPDGDDAPGDSHTVTTHKVVKKTGKAAVANDDGGAAEANRLAIKTLIHESGLTEKHFDMSEFDGMTFKEAKKMIAGIRRISEANARIILQVVGPDVAAARGVKVTESQRTATVDNGADFAQLPTL